MDIYDYDTYIFDFDGVIIDSEKYHYLSYKKSLEELNINIALTYDKYCELKHANNMLFKDYFNNYYDEIYTLKSKIYAQYIQDEIQLKAGFKEFYYNLLKAGKDVFVVTDSTRKTCNMFFKKYDFLKTINYITRNDITTRKPNSEGYLKILQTIPNIDILDKLKKIIVFEDSYCGYQAASKVFYNIVLVNTEDYYYFNTINPLNYIKDFTSIDTFKYKYDNTIKCSPFYVSSKTRHIDKWVKIKESTQFNITSQWIHKSTSKHEMTIEQKEILCQSFLDDIKQSDFGIFYSEYNDIDFFGTLIEIGMLASLNKPIYIMGDNKFKHELFYHLNKNILNFKYVNEFNIIKNIYNIYIDNDTNYKLLCKNVSSLLYNNTEVINKTYPIDYVAIVACGEGTRLFPITMHIPKILVSINNNTILHNIITYWKKYTSKFIIVIQKKYNILVEYYLKIFKIDYQIINVDIKKGQENSFTIHSAFSDIKFQHKKILLTWCDIYPESIIPETIFLNTNIIFTYKTLGRYDAVDNKIFKKQYGNVIGIYYFSDFKNITDFKDTMDICDCYMNNFGTFDTYEIESLIDIGDINKLNVIINTKDEKYITRYFNKMIPTEKNTLIKQSTCKYGDLIINNELLFYKFHYFHTVHNMPTIYNYSMNSFEMEKLENITGYMFFTKQHYTTQRIYISTILEELNNIHTIKTTIVSNSQLEYDINIEFMEKVTNRINNVLPIINEFMYIKSVNNINIIYNADYIIKSLSRKIKSYLLNDSNTYYSIHGDPHLSNIIYSNNTNYFIDPRGYFGTTKLFGPKEYDISKILYSLSGFDEFNNNEMYIFYIENTNITLSITNSMNSFLDLFPDYNKDILIYMVILHWFGLADYSKTNIHKCISAYYYGLYLYHVYCI